MSPLPVKVLLLLSKLFGLTYFPLCNNNRLYLVEYVFSPCIVIFYIYSMFLVVVDDSYNITYSDENAVVIISEYLIYASTILALLLTYISLFAKRKQINRLFFGPSRSNFEDFFVMTIAIAVVSCLDLMHYFTSRYPLLLFVVYKFPFYIYMILLAVMNSAVADIKSDYRALYLKLINIDPVRCMEETMEIFQDKQCLERSLTIINELFQLPVLSIFLINVVAVAWEIFYLVTELLNASATGNLIINTSYYFVARAFQICYSIHIWNSFKWEVCI